MEEGMSDSDSDSVHLSDDPGTVESHKKASEDLLPLSGADDTPQHME
jgi:hypothetical protein